MLECAVLEKRFSTQQQLKLGRDVGPMQLQRGPVHVWRVKLLETKTGVLSLDCACLGHTADCQLVYAW